MVRGKLPLRVGHRAVLGTSSSRKVAVMAELLTDNRPSWCQYFDGIAEATLERADCIRRKVGAVFTYKNRIISTGYNGTKEPGLPGCLTGACPRGHLSYDEQPAFEGYGNCIANHAETNGLDWILEHCPDIPLDQVVVHVGCQPCPHCQERLDFHKIAVCYPGMPPGPCPIERAG